MATLKLETECHSGAGLGLLSSIHGRGAVETAAPASQATTRTPSKIRLVRYGRKMAEEKTALSEAGGRFC